MKNYIAIAGSLLMLSACTKIEEQVDGAYSSAKNSVMQKTQQAMREKIGDSFSSLSSVEAATFRELFPVGEAAMLTDFKGKTVKLPTGSLVYLFSYKADKDLLLPFLEQQPTTDEARSDTHARKTDGQQLLSKLSFVEKFLPDNTIDFSFLHQLRDDPSIEYYKLRRLPNSSTIIYKPATKQVYHFVEVKN